MKLCENMRQVNYLFGEINSLYHQAALKLGLSDSCMEVLYTICDDGNHCPLSNIYKQTGLPKQTVNSALRKLEGEGVLYLENHTGRSKNVYLTDHGKKLAEETVMYVFKIENEIFHSWETQEVNLYISLIQRYAENLKEKINQL